ncbi:hypothetical protein [Methylorubrum sp. SB2]|uniref:hypothetical protein n=1 Tax=Methylorubrum subtropicum TaxID=3138812 RepID=UPI00313D4384
MRRAAGFAVSAALTFATSAYAETMTPEQMVAVIQKLQSRVDALETRSRQDRADATAAKAELRAIRVDRGTRRDRPIHQTAASYAVASAVPPVALISKNAALIAPIVPPASSFDGFFATVHGGYQFGAGKQTQDTYFAYANPSAISGGSIGSSLGYNITSGRFLFGFEGRGRKMFDETVARSDTGVVGRDLTVPVYTACCSGTPGIRPLLPSEVGSLPLTYQTKTRDALSRDYGGDISARFGITFGDTLLYLRLGAGANAVTSKNRVDQTGNITCTAVNGFVETGQSGYSRGFVTGCSSFVSGSVARTEKHGVQPYGILGLGLEHNFGPYFARVEGAMMNHIDANVRFFGSNYYTTEVTGAVGVRF